MCCKLTCMKDTLLKLINDTATAVLNQEAGGEIATTLLNAAIQLTGATGGVLMDNLDDHFVRKAAIPDNEVITDVEIDQITLQAEETDSWFIHSFTNTDGKSQTLLVIPLTVRSNVTSGIIALVGHKKRCLDSTMQQTLNLYQAIATMSLQSAYFDKKHHESLRARDMFISMASHELRTPLTTIHGYIQLLRKQSANRDAIEIKWIEQMYQESSRLTRLIDELLEINQIKSEKLIYNFEEHDIRSIISDVISRFRFKYPGRNLELNDYIEDKDCLIIGDYDKLLQVFYNIVDNAAKYSPEKSSITIKMKKNNEQYHISVADQGSGIAAEDLPHIFEGYFRGAHGKNTQGRGIGLHIAKRILERHHGAIDVTCAHNNGTVIKVCLSESSL